MLRKLLLTTSLLSAMGAVQAADLVTPSQSLAATCFNCHGPRGVSTAAIPSLAGRTSASIVETMAEYKTGKRTGTIMPQIAKGYSDEQIAVIATYFSQQKQ